MPHSPREMLLQSCRNDFLTKVDIYYEQILIVASREDCERCQIAVTNFFVVGLDR